MKKHVGNANPRTIAGGVIALVISAALTPVSLAQCQYSTVVIEGPPCPFGGTATLIANGLNNHGHVVGWWNHCGDAGTEAFFWSPETGRVTLPRPKEVFAALAYDINDDGLIVGEHVIIDVGTRGFVYDPKVGEFQYLDTVHGAGKSSANAINNDGIVAGRRSIGKSGEQPYNAVIWDTNTGEVTDLGVQDGPNSGALDINDAGVIVGWTGTSIPFTLGMLWAQFDVINIGPIPDGDTSNISAINDANIAVGTGWNLDNIILRGFYWNDRRLYILDPLPGFSSSGTKDINNIGQILAQVSNSSSSIISTLWQHGEMVPLNNLIAPGGVGIQTPSAINDAGQILARHIGTKAAVLTPIDQPFTDLDANCRTDVHDLIMLLDWWGECPPVKPGGVDLCRADINHDGIVNVFDLLILLGNWD